MRRTTASLRGAAGQVAVELRGMLRRLTVGRSGKLLWQLLGYEGIDGEQETFDKTEVFQGIGFASRPRPGQGEVIVANMGGRAGHPIGIANRDASIVPDLEEDETAVFNSQGIVKIDATGIVHTGTATANESAIRGDIYRTAEGNANAQVIAAMTAIAAALGLISTFLGTVNPSTGVTDGGAAAGTAATACTTTAAAATAAASAVTVFENGATVYVSPKVKVP